MLLLIGIDGATPELIERLSAAGQMPTLRALMRHGVHGRLESSVNCDPCSAWSNLLTGVNPGKHGVWSLRNLMPDSYRWWAANSRMLRAPTLPQMLTARGQTVGTVCVPVTFPAREAEWATVAGWLAPSVEHEGFAHPEDVAAIARRRLGDGTHEVRLGPDATSGRYEQGFELAVEAMRSRTALALELLDERRWDLFAVNFTELDRVLRWYWHLIDSKHIDFDEELYNTWGQLISRVHHQLDAHIARLIDLLGPDDHLMIVSPYGMGINNRAVLCLPELLSHLDLLSTRSSTRGALHNLSAGVDGWLADMRHVLREVLPGPLAELMSAPERTPEGPSDSGDPRIDYAHSYVIPSPEGDLYINHEDTFPMGIVGNGVSDRLTLQIMSALRTAIDPATGRRPLAWAKPREEVCDGPYLDRIPHLVTRWEQSGTVQGLTATGRNGRVQVARPSGGRIPSGAPAPSGIFTAAGGGLRRGTRIEGARVEDVAATIMYLRGERVPGYFDGHVLQQAMTERMIREVPVRVLQRDLPRIIEDPERVQAASEAVESGLRGTDYEL